MRISLIKGPTEHAQFRVPFVDQPVPNPRRSREPVQTGSGRTASNQSIYNGAKPNKAPKPSGENQPVPRVRRKSQGEALVPEKPKIPQNPPKTRPTAKTQPPKSPVKVKPVAKWNEPPLVTASKPKPSHIKRYPATPTEETESKDTAGTVFGYGEMLNQFREKTSPKKNEPEKSSKGRISDYESDSRAGRMRNKAKKQRSIENLAKLDENPKKSNRGRSSSRSRRNYSSSSESSSSRTRGRSRSRRRSPSTTRGRSRSKKRSKSSSSERSYRDKRGRSKSRKRSPSKHRGRSRSRRRSLSGHRGRSKSRRRSSSSERSYRRGRSKSRKRSPSTQRGRSKR